jgi:mRNA-degrading endonuclease RelE of RelBE toxin-antitoxin system
MPITFLDSRLCICNYMCMYTIHYDTGAADDLRRLKAYHQRRILAAIKTHLTRTPTVWTTRRKPLLNLVHPWEAVSPIWELRVGEYRVFYDVSEGDHIVMVRAIRQKPPGKRTEEIL